MRLYIFSDNWSAEDDILIVADSVEQARELGIRAQQDYSTVEEGRDHLQEEAFNKWRMLVGHNPPTNQALFWKHPIGVECKEAQDKLGDPKYISTHVDMSKDPKVFELDTPRILDLNEGLSG